MYAFGSGVLIGTPAGANPTPINFGLVQEVTIEESATLKELFGQNRRPLAVGAGTIKTTGKAKLARISALAFGNLFYGVAPVVGQTGAAIAELGTVPTTPFQITVANSATWSADLGVVFATTGLPLTRVASAPTTGQYSVTAGVYTFAAADTGKGMLISYNYGITATGSKILINNPLLGATISFSANLYAIDPTTNLALNLQLYNCVSSKLSFGTKLEDFVYPELDFQCFVNAAGNLGQWNFPDFA